MSNYLTQVDDLLRTDSIKYHWPEGTEELSSTVANLESVVATVGYLIRQSADGIARLPNRSDGLRTDTMAGRLNPDATKAGAVSDWSRRSGSWRSLRLIYVPLTSLWVDCSSTPKTHLRSRRH